MCKVIRTANISKKVGYKVVIKVDGRYHGFVSEYPFNGGVAPEVDYATTSYQGPEFRMKLCGSSISYSHLNKERWSMFSTRQMAISQSVNFRSGFARNPVILRCECKDITHICKWSESGDSFLCKEVTSFKEIK